MELSHIVNTEKNPVKVKIVDGSGGGSGVSYETDDEGKLVLRVVDAAPFAYDPVTDSKRVSLVAKEKVKFIKFEGTSSVDDGEDEIIKVIPPPNKVWEVVSLFFRVPPVTNASQGTNRLIIRQGVTASLCSLLRGETAYSKFIEYSYGRFTSSVDTQLPEFAQMQNDLIKGVKISNEVPLHFIYQNRTNATQTDNRIFYLVVSEVDSW
jgi:hypothetical protein